MAKISLRLPDELYQKAKEKAKREDITLSQVLRRALRKWIEEDSLKRRAKNLDNSSGA